MAFDNEPLYRLHEQLTEKAAQMSAALEQVSSDEVEDSTGQVTVRVDGDDIDIIVGSFWRSSIQPSELSGVILSTVNEMMIKRLNAFGKSFSAEAPAAAASPVPSAAAPANEIAELVASADGDVFHRNVNRFIETMSTNLQSALASLSQRASETHQGSDAQGNVRVQVDVRGSVIGLDLDESWLRSTDGGKVSDAIRTALAAAKRSASAATPANPFDGTPLEQYAEGIADPVVLIQQLTREA